MTSKDTPRQDIYSRVTNKIIADLEQGVRSWIKHVPKQRSCVGLSKERFTRPCRFEPVSAEHTAGKITRPLRHNGQPYSGINILMLWGSAMELGFSAPIWMTFRQAKELGAHIRKGEKGSPVVYANKITRTEENADGEEVEYKIPFMKAYSVFNVEQIEELPDHYYSKPEPRFDAPQRIEHAENFFAATNATLRHGGNRACYNVGSDHLQMPYFESFRDPESYYATLAHEFTHWTRHPDRLDRSFGRKRFGDEGYAREELVAELGSAFLCADLELTPEVRDDHSAYIASWLKVLKHDKRAIFTAAAHAQRAIDHLNSLQDATSVKEVA